jgi:acyl-CoA ligase (AMP-forming) (exosortase A-associated)
MISLMHHFLRRSARRLPDKEALVHGERRLSYRELDEATDRLAAALVRGGVERGDRVAIFLEKSVEEALAIWAASKAGGVFVPMNHLLFPKQVGHIVDDCRPRAIVTTGAKLEPIREIVEGSADLKCVVVTDGAEGTLDGAELNDLGEILDSAAGDPPADRCVSGDLGSILYTSGSTGRPKGVMFSQANLIAGSRIVSTYLKIGQDERILSVLPFSFDYGLNQLLTGIQHGATVILRNFRMPGDVVQTLLDERATGLAGVPPFWNLLSQPRSSLYRHSFPDLRYVTNSGGAWPKVVVDRLREALPTTEFYPMYGLTEAFRSTYLPPDKVDERPGSMGRAIPDTEIFVVNDKNELCKPGEVGELVHRGPTVSLGYWGKPEATAKVFRPNPFLPPEIQHDEKVCYSGDLVKTDEDGYLYFVGRGDATIKCSGHRVSPTEIEEVLLAHSGVREAAAFGVPDEIAGQVILAVVVPRDGQTLAEEQLIERCAQEMPRYMIPRRIEMLAELPKTPNGKIDYPTLRSRAMEAKQLGR